MTRTHFTQALLGLALLAMTGPAPAFERPNLSGNWKLNASQSNFGTDAGPPEITLAIDHKHPFLQYTKTITMPGEKRVEDVRMTVDGTKFEFTPHPGARAQARWKNDGIEVKANTDDFAYETRSHLKLDRYGKTLVEEITTKEKGKGEEKIRLVYEKQ